MVDPDGLKANWSVKVKVGNQISNQIMVCAGKSKIGQINITA